MVEFIGVITINHGSSVLAKRVITESILYWLISNEYTVEMNAKIEIPTTFQVYLHQLLPLGKNTQYLESVTFTVH